MASANLFAQHTPAGTTTEILGTGAAALLGGDLTDPENDGVDEPDMHLDPAGNWNWVSIDASHEPNFNSGEASFNIFDNKVGGGDDKWCCDDPTIDTPVSVTVEFATRVSLTHFTVTSGNDSPDRDPTDWAIQGSDDNVTFTDIYKFQGTPVPWTDRNQVVKFTLPAPATPYKFIRYIAYETPGTLHQINEIEYFGLVEGGTFTLAAPAATYNSLTFVANNTTSSALDTNSVQLTVDGQNVPVTITTEGPTSTIRYTPATWFARGSQHTFSIQARDAQGTGVTNSGSFEVPIGFFPIANLPSGTPPAEGWFVRTVFETGEAVGSLAMAMNLLTNAGGPGQLGQVIDTNSPAMDFGAGGLFTQNYPYPHTSVIGEAGPFDNFTQLGVYNLVITEEGDYTFGVHSDDGFALRIRGGQAISVNGPGQLDPYDPETVAHPATTGDSNTRAVYHLTNGTYRVEFVWYEAGGGDYAELYWAKGAFAADTASGANWVLLGTNIGPTPILPAGRNLPSPAVTNGLWATRFIWGLTDDVGNPLLIDSLARAIQLINAATNDPVMVNVVDVTAPVINWVSGGIMGGDLPLPDDVINGANWTGEDYVMLAVGHIQVPEEGDYTFGTHSDDGMAFRIIGGELLSVSGNGRLDIGSTDAVVHPGTTGDSNTRAVYHLKQGIYRVEYLYYERGGGDNGEFYVAKGAFVNDADTSWMLVGDPNGGREFRILALDAAGVTVTSSDPGGDPLTTLGDALLDYDTTAGTVSTNYPRAQVGDPETNAGVLAFPKNTPAADDNFAVKLTGNIVVATAGTYQIGFSSDDGGYIRIPGQTFLEVLPGSAAPGAIIVNGDEVQCDCLTGDANSYATITLAAGTYPFEAFMFEQGGGAYITVKGAEVGAPMALMPALATNAPATYRTPISLGPLTAEPPGVEEGTRLTIARSGNNLTISWSPEGGTLETTADLGPNANWTAVGTQNPATVQIGTGRAFYRVRN